jgi:predicted MFS family arabinose efflux permease/quinol monooxygenase YgiN
MTESVSAAAPLRRPIFAVLWAATVLGNIGTFMRDVASGWLATELTGSPTNVALLQVAGTLPIFLLAIPAGVLSDIIDRRRLLVGVQLFLACVSAALALLAATGRLSIEALIGLTFLGGIGAALIGPAWQSIVPELVPKPELRAAVALNALGFNIARAIGPAIGGALLLAIGAAATYGVDAGSYLLVIAALLWWRRPTAPDDALRERFAGAFRAGLRFAFASAELRRVLLRAALFFVGAGAIWALLPLVSRILLGGDAAFFGLSLGAVGVGAVAGATLLPRIRARFGAEGVMLIAALAVAAVLVGVAAAPPRPLALALLFVMGAAWIAALTTLSGTVQAILPNWVRGRGLSIYIMAFNGALAAGSLLWGLAAEAAGLSGALVLAALTLVVSSLVARRLPLPEGEADLMPSGHWAEPTLAAPVGGDRGPVLVTVTYRVRSEDRAAFLSALAAFAPERRRDGAYAWGVGEDAADPTRIVEWFMVESWAEHLRQHRRVTGADAERQRDALRLHEGPDPPIVSHIVSFSDDGEAPLAVTEARNDRDA